MATKPTEEQRAIYFDRWFEHMIEPTFISTIKRMLKPFQQCKRMNYVMPHESAAHQDTQPAAQPAASAPHQPLEVSLTNDASAAYSFEEGMAWLVSYVKQQIHIRMIQHVSAETIGYECRGKFDTFYNYLTNILHQSAQQRKIQRSTCRNTKSSATEKEKAALHRIAAIANNAKADNEVAAYVLGMIATTHLMPDINISVPTKHKKNQKTTTDKAEIEAAPSVVQAAAMLGSDVKQAILKVGFSTLTHDRCYELLIFMNMLHRMYISVDLQYLFKLAEYIVNPTGEDEEYIMTNRDAIIDRAAVYEENLYSYNREDMQKLHTILLDYAEGCGVAGVIPAELNFAMLDLYVIDIDAPVATH